MAHAAHPRRMEGCALQREAAEIGGYAWCGRWGAKSRLQGGSLDDRVAAQAVASNRMSLRHVRPELDTPFGFDLKLHQKSIVEAWEAHDPMGLRQLTWRQPQRFLDAMVVTVQVHAAVGQWIPASLLVRAMLRSGLDAVVPWCGMDRVEDLRAAVHDTFERSIRPQLGVAGYRDERRFDCIDRDDNIVAGLVRSWLRLRCR